MQAGSIVISSRVKCAIWESTPRSRPAKLLPPNWRGRKGIIISGGPASVYDPGSPTIDPALLTSGIPVLGICYGQQLMAHLLGGHVRKGRPGRVWLRAARHHPMPIPSSAGSKAASKSG